MDNLNMFNIIDVEFTKINDTVTRIIVTKADNTKIEINLFDIINIEFTKISDKVTRVIITKADNTKTEINLFHNKGTKEVL